MYPCNCSQLRPWESSSRCLSRRTSLTSLPKGNLLVLSIPFLHQTSRMASCCNGLIAPFLFIACTIQPLSTLHLQWPGTNSTVGLEPCFGQFTQQLYLTLRILSFLNLWPWPKIPFLLASFHLVHLILTLPQNLANRQGRKKKQGCDRFSPSWFWLVCTPHSPPCYGCVASVTHLGETSSLRS